MAWPQFQGFDYLRTESSALTGPSGSGKSTLLNCIGALETPNQAASKCVRHRSNQAGVSQSPKIPARLCGLPLPRLCPHPRPNRLRQHQPGHPTIKAMLTQIAQALDQVGAGRVRAPASANSAAANLPARSTPPTNTLRSHRGATTAGARTAPAAGPVPVALAGPAYPRNSARRQRIRQRTRPR